MPADTKKALDAVREEAAKNDPNMAQTLALQRIAATLECIRAELVMLQHTVNPPRRG